jgi:CheY-like chemotaxis protein
MVPDHESPVVFSSPKPSCVVCKGMISGVNYECPNCGARLHLKCAAVVKKLQGGCFACGKPISELPNLHQDVLDGIDGSNAEPGSDDTNAVAFNFVCADNDMQNVSLINHFLKSRFPSATLQTVHNGMEVLELVKSSINTTNPVNFVLTAGAMPLMDGWKLCRVLKQRYSGITVALMDTTAVLTTQNAGFDEIFTKPVDLDALYSFILRSWEGTSNST